MKQILKNKIKQSSYFLILLFFMLSCSKKNYIQKHPEVSQHPTAKEVVELIDDAVDLLEEKGTAAFDDFREPDSKWRYDDIYLYIFTLEGVNLFHPREDLHGINFINIPDEQKSEIVKSIIEVVKTNKEGWVAFLWVAPNDTKESIKYGYAKEVIVDGKLSFIGAGFHPKNY